ncbi:hypothetical protein AB6813_09120 [bacterium RCC_150]
MSRESKAYPFDCWHGEDAAASSCSPDEVAQGGQGRGTVEYESGLLRRSHTEGAKVKQATVANLATLPGHAVESLRAPLAGKTLIGATAELGVVRSQLEYEVLSTSSGIPVAVRVVPGNTAGPAAFTHVFLCILSAHLTWHLRHALAP